MVLIRSRIFSRGSHQTMFFYYMEPLYLYYCAQRAITVLCVKEWLEYLKIFSKPTKKVLFLYISPC